MFWEVSLYVKSRLMNLRCVWQATAGSIWKARNELVMQNILQQASKILADIQAMSFLWIRSRGQVSGGMHGSWLSYSKQRLKGGVDFFL